MTVEEAYQSYGSKVFTASVEMNIVTIVRILYGSDDDRYLNVLRVLNPRINWSSLPAGAEIQYLDSSVIKEFLF